MTHLNQSPSHVQPDDVSPRSQQPIDLSHSPLREYEVTLSSGEMMYILAANSEEAAWHALELSEDRNAVLIDVRLVDEW